MVIYFIILQSLNNYVAIKKNYKVEHSYTKIVIQNIQIACKTYLYKVCSKTLKAFFKMTYNIRIANFYKFNIQCRF